MVDRTRIWLKRDEDGKGVVKCFVSYASVDQEPKQEFLQLLKSNFQFIEQSTTYRFELWDDELLNVGEPWHQRIQEKLDECSLGILLISVNFLTSRYISMHELPKLIQTHGKRVVPVLLNCVPEDGDAALGALGALQIYGWRPNQAGAFVPLPREHRQKWIGGLVQSICAVLGDHADLIPEPPAEPVPRAVLGLKVDGERLYCTLSTERVGNGYVGSRTQIRETHCELKPAPHQRSALNALARLRRIVDAVDLDFDERSSSQSETTGDLGQALQTVVPELTAALGGGLSELLFSEESVRETLQRWLDPQTYGEESIENFYLDLDFSESAIPGLEVLPWEYLALPNHDNKFLYSEGAILVRRHRAPRPVGTRAQGSTTREETPRMLLIATDPNQTAMEQLEAIEQALAPARDEGRLELQVLGGEQLSGDGFREFADLLGGAHEFDIIHMIVPVQRSSSGDTLGFREPRRGRKVGRCQKRVEQVMSHLVKQPRRLIFVQPQNESESLQIDEPMIFRMLPSGHHCATVGALIGMQSPAQSKEGTYFVEAFYRELARSQAIDGAFSLSRRDAQSEMDHRRHPPFASPVLYLWEDPFVVIPPKPGRKKPLPSAKQRPIDGGRSASLSGPVAGPGRRSL